MEKKASTEKAGDSNKENKPKTNQQASTNTNTNTKQPTAKKETKPAPKKEGAKLNPVKPRGKNSETEKKSLKQTNPSTSRNTKFNSGGKNSKKEKKEPEKELYLRFGKHVLNIKEEEQDLDDNTFLRYNVIGILFTGSWVPPAKEFMVKLEELYSEIIRNKFQVERGKIVHVLMCDRKYKDLVKKILKLYKENNTQESIKLFKELIKLLIY